MFDHALLSVVVMLTAIRVVAVGRCCNVSVVRSYSRSGGCQGAAQCMCLYAQGLDCTHHQHVYGDKVMRVPCVGAVDRTASRLLNFGSAFPDTAVGVHVPTASRHLIFRPAYDNACMCHVSFISRVDVHYVREWFLT